MSIAQIWKKKINSESIIFVFWIPKLYAIDILMLLIINDMNCIEELLVLYN